MPHSHGGGRPSRREAVNTTKFYELLGCTKDASEADIKKAFRRSAMTHHPDKGGDPEKFKEISKAYECLSDPEKKALYDQYGEEGIENGGAGGGSAHSDILEMMFGGGGARERAPKGKAKGEDVVFPLKVTLEDLYVGAKKKLRLTKSVICTGCAGQGGKGASMCRDCKGQGVRVVVRQIGPGMIQQMQTSCSSCKGTGTVIAEKDKCKKCLGEKTVKEKKTLEVFVNKGMRNNEKIVFNGEADEAPDTVSGDVVVVLQQAEHALLRREGPSLYMKKTITLVEALTGFHFYLKQLDGRVLHVKNEPGAIYKTGDVKCIKGEGMPYPNTPYQKGNLFIEFNVQFPEKLDDKARALLIKCLPPAPPQVAPPCKRKETKVDDDGMEVEYEVDDVPEEHFLTEFDLQQEREAQRAYSQSHQNQYDEDEEGAGRGAQQSCRAQ